MKLAKCTCDIQLNGTCHTHTHTHRGQWTTVAYRLIHKRRLSTEEGKSLCRTVHQGVICWGAREHCGRLENCSYHTGQTADWHDQTELSRRLIAGLRHCIGWTVGRMTSRMMTSSCADYEMRAHRSVSKNTDNEISRYGCCIIIIARMCFC